ncbi:MAG: preQ(1) synthase [Elusimicrobiota bacterium]|jgi:7-cyano-7-deazaguanine reductase|nr:preQ(1) synthase [Elusimicrobiota bacterium]
MENKRPVFDSISPNLLEPMPYQYIGKDIAVNIETDEFTCLCPWTGLPDYAHLTIKYTPNQKVIELKSLKLYLHTYRMVGIVHESAVNKIKEDLAAAIEPQDMFIELKFAVRGGLITTVSAQFNK